MPNNKRSPRFGRRIANALSPRLSMPRAVPPWITVQDVDEDDEGDTASGGGGSGGGGSAAGTVSRSREALTAFRRRVSSSVTASMRVKKSKAAATPAAPRKARTKSVSFEVSLLPVLNDP